MRGALRVVEVFFDTTLFPSEALRQISKVHPAHTQRTRGLVFWKLPYCQPLPMRLLVKAVPTSL